MNLSLSSKTAVVTGGASGIGRAIAESFSAAGAGVWIFDLDHAAAKETVRRISETGGAARSVEVDVGDFEQMSAAFAALPRCDVLVNNAGIGHIGTVETTAPEDMERLHRVNVMGVYHGMHLAVPRMLAQGGGVILNMASIAAKVGLEARFAYSAAKGAVLAMTVQAARDYVGRGIRCNCLCPARIHTPFVDSYLQRNYPGREAEMFAKLAAAQPLGRMGAPEEVASAALFLCSDASRFITGVAYDVDGGVLGTR